MDKTHNVLKNQKLTKIYTAADLYDFAGSVLKKCPVVLLYKKNVQRTYITYGTRSIILSRTIYAYLEYSSRGVVHVIDQESQLVHSIHNS